MHRTAWVACPVLAAVLAASPLAGATSLPASPVTTTAGATTTTTVPSSPPPTASNCKVKVGTAWTGGVAEHQEPLPPPPTGFVAVDIYSVGQASPFTPAVVANHLISGVDLLIQWCNLEPGPDAFNWGPVDQVFQQADSDHKFVVLTLIPGFETPAWALSGVQQVTSSWSYNGKAGTRTLPMPWDGTYLSRWFSFLQDVADRYGNNAEFRMVEVAGPTSVSTEMSLPDATGAPGDTDAGLPPIYEGSDIKMWEAMGYTQAAYVGAWQSAFAAYHKYFLDQYLALALYPGLPIAVGSCDATCESTETRLDVVAAGKQYNGSFVLQEDGLAGNGTERDPGYNTVKANCASVVTGLQTKAPPKDDPLDAAVQHGVNAGVDFIEVYESEVKSMQGVLDSFDNPPMLPANKNCAPLTLQALPSSATLGTAATVTAVTDLNLSPGERVNISVGGAVIHTCKTATCTVSVSPGKGLTVYEADVGAAGTAPFSTQALVSTRTSVERSLPHCKGYDCS